MRLRRPTYKVLYTWSEWPDCWYLGWGCFSKASSLITKYVTLVKFHITAWVDVEVFVLFFFLFNFVYTNEEIQLRLHLFQKSHQSSQPHHTTKWKEVCLLSEEIFLHFIQFCTRHFLDKNLIYMFFQKFCSLNPSTNCNDHYLLCSYPSILLKTQ